MLEKIGYIFLGIVFVIYIGAILVGMITAWPFGIIGFCILAGVGALFIKVLRERLNNREDDHYSKNVHQ